MREIKDATVIQGDYKITIRLNEGKSITIMEIGILKEGEIGSQYIRLEIPYNPGDQKTRVTDVRVEVENDKNLLNVVIINPQEIKQYPISLML